LKYGADTSSEKVGELRYTYCGIDDVFPEGDA